MAGSGEDAPGPGEQAARTSGNTDQGARAVRGIGDLFSTGGKRP
ncbi:MAG: hypothetical protein ACF8XB_04195 [Planctomycetota bacterium JB042]